MEKENRGVCGRNRDVMAMGNLGCENGDKTAMMRVAVQSAWKQGCVEGSDCGDSKVTES